MEERSNASVQDKNRKAVFSDLAVGISAVLQTRKDLEFEILCPM